MSPVVKYDLEDVEAGASGEQPQPAVYTVKIAEINDRRGQDGKNDLEVIVDFFQDEGIARVWSYLNFGDSSRWKFREFTDALGLKAKGQFDPAKLVNKKVNVKISGDQYQGEYRARVNRWMKPGKVSENGEEPEEGEEGDEAEAAAEEDYSEWTVDELKDEIEERGLEMPSGRKTAAKLITVLEESDASEEEPEEEAGEEEAADDYDEWPLNDLKDEANERGLEMPDLVKGRGAAAKNKAAMIELLREDDQHPFEQS